MSSASAGARPTAEAAAGARRERGAPVRAGGRLPEWWPLAALLVLGAAVRFSTIDLQSLWYDEAFTPVHTLRPSLGTTLHELVRHENTPPLWYVLEWLLTRAFGTGALALRFLSALAGSALVAVGWGIGRELGSRRTAALLAALVALNPFFVWYSQEARAYEFYALFCGCSLLCFLRARRLGTPAALAWWSGSSVLALLSEYFSVFLVLLEALVLLADEARSAGAGGAGARRPRGLALPRATLLACLPIAICGGALLPLLLAQGGHGTQWIGSWALSSRLIQTPGYYLLGAEGSKLGHGLLALAAIPGLAAIGLLAWLVAGRGLGRREYDELLLTLGLGVLAILIPLALALVGPDYFAPRNLIGDWVPLSAALALVLTVPAAGRAGLAIAVLVCLGFAAAVLATDVSSKLQRGDWSRVAQLARPGAGERAIVTVQLGSAPLEYYLPRMALRALAPGESVRVREVQEVGYRPLRPGATLPPTAAFRPAGHGEVHGLLIYRFLAATPQLLSERLLGTLVLTGEGGETLVPAAVTPVGS